MDGTKGGRVLVYQGFRYQKNRAGKATINWRCWRKRCRVTLKTNLFDTTNENARIQVLHVRKIYFTMSPSYQLKTFFQCKIDFYFTE